MRAADSARVVHLCAARCTPFVAHKWPTHALRLTQALDSEIEKQLHVGIWFRLSVAGAIQVFCEDRHL